MSLARLAGNWDLEIVMSSVRIAQAQAAAKGFWQLEQPDTSLVSGFPRETFARERVMCCT